MGTAETNIKVMDGEYARDWTSLHNDPAEDIASFTEAAEAREREKLRLAAMALDGQTMVEYAYGDMDHVS